MIWSEKKSPSINQLIYRVSRIFFRKTPGIGPKIATFGATFRNKVIVTRGQDERVGSPRELTTTHRTVASLKLDCPLSDTSNFKA